jgi:hypothetical protein
MPTIDEIRQKYPQYGDMSDTALADSLHDKYYKDMPREQFNEKIGLQTAPATPTAEPSSKVGDFFKSIPRGAVEGFMSAAAPLAQGEAGMMGQPEQQAQVPTAQESTKLLEKNVTGEMHKPEGRAGKFGAALGEVAGNPASWVGPGSAALKAGTGALSAFGGEAAGQALEGTKLEGPARIAGSVLAGTAGAAAAAERNLSKLATQLPTPEKIKADATAGYEFLKKSDTRISPEATQELLAKIQTDLVADHFRDYSQPVTFRTIEELSAKGSATIGDIDSVRQVLNRHRSLPSEREASNRAIKAIDDFLQNIPDHQVISGDPARDAEILRHAQKSWAAYKQLEMIDEASIKGQHRAGVSGSGANRINTTRQEIRKILDSDRKSRGLSDTAKDKMEEIVMGTWATNRARQLGKFAPSGPVSASASILTGMGAGPGAGVAVAGGGFIAKYLGEYLTQKQIGELEQIIRGEAPTGKAAAAAIKTPMAEQKMIPAAAAVRSALTSPLAPGGP